MEVKRAVKDAFELAKTNQIDNSYYLFLSIAQKVNSFGIAGHNPYAVDYRMDGYNDELRLNTLLEYVNHNYTLKGANTIDTGFTISVELMIYTHMWESKPVLKQLKRLVNLIDSEPYDWDVEVPDMGKHLFIRNEIRDKLSNKGLHLAEIISNGFHSQLRNAFAHSDYALEMDTPKIELLNFSQTSWQMRSITFDEWTERFCYTFLLSFYLHNTFQEERQTLASGNYNVKLKDINGIDQDGILTYTQNVNRFTAGIITPT